MSTLSPVSLSHHVPILLEPITDFLVEGLRSLPETAAPGLILDCTLGGGGHTSRLLEKMALHPELKKHRVLGIDRDPDAIGRNQTRFKADLEAERLEVTHSSFSESLLAVNGRPIYGLMADLGISSDQIDSETRGFSFRYPAPLDMRMNTTRGISLKEWLETAGETQISDVIWKYGEDRFSRKIARKLVDLRAKSALPQNTLELAEAIASTFPPALRYKGIHPATRTFQAFRIEINEELKELETLISKIFPAVAPGGRLAILSFHSLEDRLVKEVFRNQNEYDLPSRKAIQASDEEVEANSRSRSAKLRLAIRK